MDNKKQSLVELGQSLNRDLSKLQDVLQKLSLELSRFNLEYHWVTDKNKQMN